MSSPISWAKLGQNKDRWAKKAAIEWCRHLMNINKSSRGRFVVLYVLYADC